MNDRLPASGSRPDPPPLSSAEFWDGEVIVRMETTLHFELVDHFSLHCGEWTRCDSSQEEVTGNPGAVRCEYHTIASDGCAIPEPFFTETLEPFPPPPLSWIDYHLLSGKRVLFRHLMWCLPGCTGEDRIPFRAISEIAARPIGISLAGRFFNDWWKPEDAEEGHSTDWYCNGVRTPWDPRPALGTPPGLADGDWLALLQDWRYVKHHTHSTLANTFHWKSHSRRDDPSDFIDLLLHLPQEQIPLLPISPSAREWIRTQGLAQGIHG